MRVPASNPSHTGIGDGPAMPELFIGRDVAPEARLRRAELAARLTRWADRAGLVLLIMAVGALLFRPSDLVPALEGASIYELCMVLCIGAALPRLGAVLRPAAIRGDAITACALVFVACIVVSHLARADTWSARIDGVEAAKSCILFLLILALVNTWEKLRLLLLVTAASVLGVTVLALLSYHGVIYLPALGSVEQPGAEGGPPLLRLCATGIFNDPNDYSLMLVLCLCVCVYVLGWRRLGPRRWLAAAPFGVFAYALVLTHSRGGLMSGAAGALGFLAARYGWRNAIPLVGVLSLVMLAPFWGRQTTWNVSDPEDTFQARLELWSDSFEAFRGSPLLGVGKGRLVEDIGQVTHNSYLQAFSELGIVGGTVFVGLFFLAVRGLWRARAGQGEAARLRPCLMAISFGYAAGLLTLTRCYTVSTQLVVALGATYLRLSPGMVLPRLDGRCLRALALAAAAFLGLTYVFLRVMLLRGR